MRLAESARFEVKSAFSLLQLSLCGKKVRSTCTALSPAHIVAGRKCFFGRWLVAQATDINAV